MTYASGQLITTTEYNTFVQGGDSATANVACINNVWGTGYGSVGYGQSTTVSAVSSAGIVTATQWSTLVARLNSILTHQTGSGTGYTNPTAGATIATLSSLSTNMTNTYNNALNCASQGSTTTGSNFTVNQNVAATTVAQTFTITRTVTFASAEQARYFFNAGGQLTYAVSGTNAAGTNRSADLITMCNYLTTFDRFAASGSGTTTRPSGGTGRTGTGGSSVTNTTNLGYYQTTASAQTLFAATSTTSLYTGDTISLTVTGGAGTGTGGRGATLTFTLTLYSAARAASGNQQINNTYTTRIDIVNPETTNLTNTWGSITIT